MSDSVFSVGLRSVEYFRELKNLRELTDRELQKVEARIATMERRADRELARGLRAERSALQERLQDRQNYESLVASLRRNAHKENAKINARLDADLGAAARAAEAARFATIAEARAAEIAVHTAHHARLENRTRLHAMRMEAIQAGHTGRMSMMSLTRLGPAASMAGIPGLGRLGGLARMGPVGGVIAAGVGTAALGANVYADATAKSPDAVAALKKAQSDLASAYGSVVEDSTWWAGSISKAVGVTGSALAKAWKTAIDITAFYVSGGDGANVRGVNEARATELAMDAERQRRMAGMAVGDSVFGVDPTVARRRRLNEAINASGLGGTTQEGELRARLAEVEEAEAAKAAKEAAEKAAKEAERERTSADQRRVADQMLDAQAAVERAKATEGTEDDKQAARLLYKSQLEESRARVMADETIPEAEKHNRIMRESAVLGAQYAAVLQSIEEGEAEVARRTAEKNAAASAAAELFREQLAIEQAAASGNTREAGRLRAEADYRRRIEEIGRLGLSGDDRADAERRAMAIRQAELNPEQRTRTVGMAGLAGGDTLRRQIQGAAGPQQKMVSLTEKISRTLEQIRDQRGGVAVAG